ncbi:hypothetical protein B1218_38635, partial [Pseudomonas ogarae]
DLKAAAELGIQVCGTDSYTHPPPELTSAPTMPLAHSLDPSANPPRPGALPMGTRAAVNL